MQSLRELSAQDVNRGRRYKRERERGKPISLAISGSGEKKLEQTV